MISLILTALYLAKDTVHRWFTRISSPIARILVVYFLTLCALTLLGGFVISVNIVRDEIVKSGGNIVVSSMSPQTETQPYLPTKAEIDRELDADSYYLIHVGSALTEKKSSVSVFTFPFTRSAQMLPLLAASGRPTLLQSRENRLLPPGPARVFIADIPVDILVQTLPDGHPLAHTLRNAPGIVLPPDRIPQLMFSSKNYQRSLIMAVFRVRNFTSSQSVTRIERYLRNLQRYEKLVGNVISASGLLKKMDTVLNHQMQCRIAICLGISAIVGILLTALAGMEYRQNEYIYTLMKSFGIHPLMLVSAFILENIFIVGTSFAAAVVTFTYTQRALITQIPLPRIHHYILSFQEIKPEVMLISYTLLACVIISAVPIFFAANRQIGRVLQ